MDVDRHSFSSENTPKLAGGSLTETEQIELSDYKSKSDAKPRRTKKFEQILRSVSDKVENTYPNARRGLEKMLDHGGDVEPYSSGSIRAGDLCGNATYFVSIPADTVLRKLLKKYVDRNTEKRGLSRIIEYNNSVYRGIPHMFDLLDKDDDHHTKAMDEVWTKLYGGKVVRLEDVITRDAPGVCFEQALILNYLLSSDDYIKNLGGKTRIGMGYQLSDGKFGEHAWVVLTFDTVHPKSGINDTVYVLDPAYGKMFVYDALNDSTEYRYIEQSDTELIEEGDYIIRRKR